MRHLSTQNIRMSKFGNPEPQIEVVCPAGTSIRQIRSYLHMLAGKAEVESEKEDWLIHIEILEPKDDMPRGRVWVELVTCQGPEMVRAVEMLNRAHDNAIYKTANSR